MYCMPLAFLVYHNNFDPLTELSLHVCGEPQVMYVSDVTPMIIYLNAHMAVDQMRTKSESEGKIGTKVRQKYCDCLL